MKGKPMPSLAKMAANAASVTFDYNGETVSLEYYPDRFTDKLIAESDASREATNQGLVQLIKSWNLFEDAEETIPLPIDVEHVALLGLPFKNEVINQITQDMRPNR
jgi:hypothetical protein